MMKKTSLLILGLLLGSTVYAADGNEVGLFESLRQKIELLTPKKKLTTTTSVGGVRGSLADADVLYWKGEKTDLTIDAAELMAFDEALSQAEAGNQASAEKGLADFLSNYPDSQLRADAEQALALVKQQATTPPSLQHEQ
jgi:TolA-binding protein